MAIASGRSSIRTEIDAFIETLENMIESTEVGFRVKSESLKAKIFDIEHDFTLNSEEKSDLSKPYLEELDICISQHYQARNKLILCIYSICETMLSSICDDFSVAVKYYKSSYKKRPFYLSDYLHSIGVDFHTSETSAYIIYSSIRNLRNYLTHSKPKVDVATGIVNSLDSCGINGITQDCGRMIINNAETLNCILEHCKNMLIEAEECARNISQK